MAKKIYLVKTTFKSGGEVFLAGDLLDDLSEVRLFKVRMNEGKLVPLPEGKDLDNLATYFKDRYAIDLKARIKEFNSKGSDSAETDKPEASIPPTGTPAKPLEAPKDVTPKAVVPPAKTTPKVVSPIQQKPQPLSGGKPKTIVANTTKK